MLKELVDQTMGALEAAATSLPLPLLELWAYVAFAIGAVLCIPFLGRLTPRPGGHWGMGREKQTWNSRAFLALGLTFVLMPLAGWAGSSIVIVEGAQTFESLKDIVFFCSVFLFGFPALIVLPIAYQVSDVIEGIPPAWSAIWTHGYYFLSAYAWVGYQLIGRDPDFRRLRTWARYVPFALFILAFDPVMWGLICGNKFPAEIAYRQISTGVLFTKSITFMLLPFFMLALLPLARRYGMFWAEIPGHVRQKPLGAPDWTWESGQGVAASGDADTFAGEGVPLRMLLAGSFIALVLAVAGPVAYVTLASGAAGANKLAQRLHQEVAANIDLRLDDYLDRSSAQLRESRLKGMGELLAGLPIAKSGRALVLDLDGRLLASSIAAGIDDPAVQVALRAVRERAPELAALQQPLDFRFDVVTAKPLSRETWLAQATPYTDKGGSVHWIALTAMPESSYLAELQAGNSNTAVLAALALTVAMVVAGLLAGAVTAPIRRITRAAEAMADGDLSQTVARSRLGELQGLVHAFNRMSGQLQASFRQVKRSEETIKGIFSATPVAMAVFQTDTMLPTAADLRRGRTILDVNEAWVRLTGYSREQAIGNTSSGLALWADWDDRQKFVTAMYQDGGIRGFEANMRRADGSTYHALVSGRDAVVADERLSIVAFEDVTALRDASARLQELNRQLNALLDAALEVAIIATDPAGRITVFNHGAERMLGYDAAEMLGESALRVHLADDLAAHGHELALQAGEPVSAERLYAAQTADGGSGIRNWILQRKDGRPVQVSTALSAVRDEAGRTLGYLGISRDITEQLAAQAEMIELNASLDRRVQERTLALQESKAKLEQAMAHMQQMQGKLVQSEKLAGLASIVAAVAHELNTPIGNSVTVASTLNGDTAKILREMAEGSLRKQRFSEYLEGMRSGTALLERALQTAATLVSNFKRVAVDQGSENRRVFELRTTIEDTLAILKPMLKKTPFRVELELPDGIHMDSYPGALEQVLGNLVNNAVLHGFAGRSEGRMRLSASVDAERQYLTLVFADDGVGMNAATVARIYDPFFTTALGKGGSGLGMHISYNLVTGPLGGEIAVDSQPGEGTTVTLTLPLSAPVHQAAPAVAG